MKKSKKRIIICVSFFIAFFSLFSSFTEVFGATDLLRQEELPYYKQVAVNPAYGVFSGKTSRWSWYGLKSNIGDEGSGDTKLSAYCLDIEAPVYAGTLYTSSSTWGGLSTYQQNLVNYALVFGYGSGTTKYGYAWDTEYCATQALIWMIVSGYYGTPYEGDIVAGLLAQVPWGTDCYYRIRNNATSFQYAPSFASKSPTYAPTITLQYDRSTAQYSTTIYDSNGVLNAYDFSMSGVSFSKNGNYLTITTSNDLSASSAIAGSEQKDLQAAASSATGTIISGAPTYWTSAGGQPQVQMNTLVPVNDPVYAYIKLESANPGTLTINKTSEDGTLAGFQFHVVGNGVDEVVTTGDDGIIIMQNMPVGTYTVTEVNTPVRYYQPDAQNVSIAESGSLTINFDNDLYFGAIQIVKTSEDGTLAGFQFHVTNELGYDEIVSTGDDGIINITDLVPVEYTVTEINTPDMYNQPDDQTVLVQDHGRVTTATFDNTIKKGTVSFVKSSRLNGKLLGNSTYGVFAVSDGSLVDTITTDTAGSGSSNIPLLYGKYYLKEIKAPFGYDLDDDMYPFNINVNGEVEEMDVSDPPLIGTLTTDYQYDTYTISKAFTVIAPNTGDHNICTIILYTVIAFASGGLVILLKVRKGKKHE